AIIALCREFGCRALAEGIETQDQLEWLTAAGCHEGQGYWIGMPSSKKDLGWASGSREKERGRKAPLPAPKRTVLWRDGSRPLVVGFHVLQGDRRVVPGVPCAAEVLHPLGHQPVDGLARRAQVVPGVKLLRRLKKRLADRPRHREAEDRKSTRLNSSHVKSSYAVLCLKKQT